MMVLGIGITIIVYDRRR